MADLPVMLKVKGRRCVVVGGGGVAVRRARSLVEAGAEVVVISPEVDEQLEAMAVVLKRRGYRSGDADGARLVVVASDDAAVNERAAQEAAAAGALVNRTDEAGEGDVAIPAHGRAGPVSVAVDTGGISARAAAAIRDELMGKLDPDWPRLLEAVRPFRERIRKGVAEGPERQRRLRMLADEEAMRVLKRQGVEAVRQRCQGICGGR